MAENAQPIFIQIKEKIKDDILAGVYGAHELILSTTQIARLYGVNPTTAVRSVGLLQDEGVVYKRRGIGMCVAEGAREQIRRERTEAFYGSVIRQTIGEAKKIGLAKAELIRLIEETQDYD